VLQKSIFYRQYLRLDNIYCLIIFMTKLITNKGGVGMGSNLLTIKIKDEEILRRCKVLYRMNGVIIETLLKLLFERVDVTDILKTYLEGGKEGVKELVIETFKQLKEQQEDDLFSVLENENWNLRI
jgi:hypothetical protein